MGGAGAACALLLVATTLIHYEALRALGALLPRLGMPSRARLIVVIVGTFVAHAVEIVPYAAAACALARWPSGGSLGPTDALPFDRVLYFSAETCTSLGYGDVLPHGPLRMLAGSEALNGLLLIGWSASFIYVAMERFWRLDGRAG